VLVRLRERDRGDCVRPPSLAYALVIGDIGVIGGAVGGEHTPGDGDCAGRDRISGYGNRSGRNGRAGRDALVGGGRHPGITGIR
jgi:hypothetical protein